MHAEQNDNRSESNLLAPIQAALVCSVPIGLMANLDILCNCSGKECLELRGTRYIQGPCGYIGSSPVNAGDKNGWLMKGTTAHVFFGMSCRLVSADTPLL
ncbi:hypothetical protein LshimejAT787_0801670 [Lyophyllum shimeji]|uniref:Uncharacterized protein n=1 Tax=Lyophyllum shimeji TaxID=47721 RepID=A0A9P3PR98_LYOSH|nr:hypothetical protein LshimejAT787_0801670 [Lyophyllum shimeji]